MKETNFAELKLFITGPTYVREQVRQAGLLPEFGHRDLENNKRFGPIMAHLKKLAGISNEFEVILFNGSGSTAMEASIRSLVANDETVLNVSVGAFGDLYHKMAVANGKRAVQLKFDYGRAIDLKELEKALQEHKPGVVTFTHNETSTGVVNDIVAVCALIKKYNALALVDGVSILGGARISIQEAAPAMYSASTQKSLGLPAGFGIGFVNAEALKKAETVTNRGHASDILNQIARARKTQTLTTPNCTLANQMCVQLDYIVNREDVENRFKRHEKMRDRVHAWVDGLEGFELFAQENHRSPTLTCVQTPKGVTFAALKKIKEEMRTKGYLFDPGYGKLNNYLEEHGRQTVFRVGHMGDITPEMLEQYLGDLEEILRKNNLGG
ncbi:MAG: aminotransferase class V-fold PLP-dependent enzyme [Thermodesulfobacteriota bacterium]|nr:aminotransferase class V-fold PLP-dependent enzyme [Thermodesulfobacteriota bacterium]